MTGFAASGPIAPKPNTAVPQAFYNSAEGTKKLTTETGAGQWGSALALATTLFGLECEVWQVRISFDQKPYRRSMMETWGATVHPSPSNLTAAGRAVLEQDPDSPGSLGASDIWVATRATSGERFGPARNLGAPVNSSSSDGLPNISADGRSLYFSSRRATVAGDMDLWVARRDTDAGRFSGGENLGPTINSSHYDGEPGISADGRYLFFSSDRPGGSGQRDQSSQRAISRRPLRAAPQSGLARERPSA